MTMASDPGHSHSGARIFVLIHGAWHGGWCWERVAQRLAAQGHAVHAPTLAGVAERAHLADEHEITLESQTAEVVAHIRDHDLRDIVLVGHSYGGFVVSGVAEQVADRIRAIVLLDAFVPDDGKALVDYTAPAASAAMRDLFASGARVAPPIPPAVFRVNEADRAWVEAMCTPHPIRCFVDPVRLTGARERIARKVYIRATDYPSAPFDAAKARLSADPSWIIHGIASGHDVMVDKPDELAEALMRLT